MRSASRTPMWSAVATIRIPPCPAQRTEGVDDALHLAPRVQRRLHHGRIPVCTTVPSTTMCGSRRRPQLETTLAACLRERNARPGFGNPGPGVPVRPMTAKTVHILPVSPPDCPMRRDHRVRSSPLRQAARNRVTFLDRTCPIDYNGVGIFASFPLLVLLLQLVWLDEPTRVLPVPMGARA
jgi:hypothetical protein